MIAVRGSKLALLIQLLIYITKYPVQLMYPIQLTESGADRAPGANVRHLQTRAAQDGKTENVTHQRRSTVENHVLVNLSR